MMDKIFDYEDIHQKKIAIRQDVESFKKEVDELIKYALNKQNNKAS